MTQVIENVVSTLSGITDINSASSLGVSRVIFPSIPASDQQQPPPTRWPPWSPPRSAACPPGVSPPTIQTFDPNSQPILQFGLSRRGSEPGRGERLRAEHASRPMLERIAGRGQRRDRRGPTKQFQVLLNPERLRYYNLTPQQVVRGHHRSALNLPIGTIVNRSNALTFTTQNTPCRPRRKIARTLVDSGPRHLRSATSAIVRGMPVAHELRPRERQAAGAGLHPADHRLQLGRRGRQGVRDLLARTTLPAGYLLTFSNDTTGPDPGLGPGHLPRAASHRAGRRPHRAAVPGEAEHRLLRHPGHPHRAVRLADPLPAGRLLLQPRVAARADHGHRHRGRRLDRRGGERGALPRHGLQPRRSRC